MARILGNVNAQGTIVDGTNGFSVEAHQGGQPGAWTIEYKEDFAAPPTLLVSLVNAEWNMTYRTRSRADGCDIETFRNDGTPLAASFDFAAIGDR